MAWFLWFVAFYFVFKKGFWLYALHVTLKQQRRMRIEIVPGDASQLPEIDSSDLQPLTAELQALGFVVLGDLLSKMDYAPETPLDPAPIPHPQPAPSGKSMAESETRGIARILAHPEYGCYASLISVMSVSRFSPEMKRADMVNVAPFRTVIASAAGYEDDAWSYVTHNREVDPFSLLNHHPRWLSHRLVGASARQLLESHLAERAELANRVGVTWDQSPSLEKYLIVEDRAIRHIRKVYQRLHTPGVAWHLQTYRLKKHERWMGELA
jgi:hypothetical protein